jgi:diketogulonate reductase-like aldo/keto reductase
MHWHLSFEYKGDGVLTDDENMKPTDVPITETWHAMEQLVKDGVARSIGVSNFTIPMLQDILDNCEIPPAVHQIEIHPNLDQQDMVDFCASKNITLIAYSPLGNPGFRQELKIKIMDEPVVRKEKM